MNILIFAGGTGSRLWPVSRQASPKQILKLVENKTLLESTYDRCKSWVDEDRIFIATLSQYEPVIKKQLPNISKKNYSLEPVLRDRGPAIALASLIMNHHDPNSTFMTMWSDHVIKEPKGYFKKILKHAENYLDKNPQHILTVGIKPDFPHTGFGYIQKSGQIKHHKDLPLFKVGSFKEKPDLNTAGKFVKSGKYLWNTGYFIWKTETILSLYKEHLPEIYNILMKIRPHLNTKSQQKAIDKWYPKMPKVEVENGILEKVADQIKTIEAEMSWHDVGSWKIIKDIQSQKEQNVFKGLSLDYNSRNTLVYNYNPEQLVATLGVNNLAVIVTEDAILIADKDNSEELKQLIKKLKENKKYKRYL